MEEKGRQREKYLFKLNCADVSNTIRMSDEKRLIFDVKS